MSRLLIMLSGLLILPALSLQAQGVAPLQYRLSNQYGSSQFDTSLVGGTVTIHIVETAPNGYRRDITFSAQLVDLDFTESEVWIDRDPGVRPDIPTLSLECRAAVPNCWRKSGRMTVGADAPYDSNQMESDHDRVPCHERATCERFLNELRVAAGAGVDCNALRATPGAPGTRPVLPAGCMTDLDRATTPISRATPVAPSPPAATEPVIDGSKIPSRIDFTPTAPAAAPPPPAISQPALPRPAPVPTREPVAPFGGGGLAPGRVEEFRPLFQDDAAGVAPARSGVLDDAKKWVDSHWQELAGAAFDVAVEKGDVTSVSWSRFLVREVVSDQVQNYFSQNLASQVTFGRSWDALPEVFRKDKAVLDAVFEQFGSPLKGGIKLVNAFGELFDLW